MWRANGRIRRAISEFADASRGWIVGDSGAMFTTVDGGRTWNAADPSVTGDLQDIEKGADGTLWAVGEWGTIIKSKIN